MGAWWMLSTTANRRGAGVESGQHLRACRSAPQPRPPVTGETGGAVAGMTGVNSDVFAVTAVTAVTGGSDVPAVTSEGGRDRNPRAAPAVTSVTDRRGSTWAGGRDKIAVKVKGSRAQSVLNSIE